MADLGRNDFVFLKKHGPSLRDFAFASFLHQSEIQRLKPLARLWGVPTGLYRRNAVGMADIDSHDVVFQKKYRPSLRDFAFASFLHQSEIQRLKLLAKT